MKYKSLKNGVLFRTDQRYTWVAVDNNIYITNDDGEDTLNGEILLSAATSWTVVTNFDCSTDAVQATWED